MKKFELKTRVCKKMYIENELFIYEQSIIIESRLEQDRQAQEEYDRLLNALNEMEEKFKQGVIDDIDNEYYINIYKELYGCKP